MFPLFATGVMTPVANLPQPVSTTPVVPVAKFAAGVIDTRDKFATSVVDTGGKFAPGVADTVGAPLLANISMNFGKKLK